MLDAVQQHLVVQTVQKIGSSANWFYLNVATIPIFMH